MHLQAVLHPFLMKEQLAVQVSSRTASAAALSAAARLGKGKAALALELVGYDQDLGAAMKYAFGNAFICRVRQFCAFCVRQHACALHGEQSLDMRLWQGFVRKASALNAAMPCLCSQE